MAEYTLTQLEAWNGKIEALAREEGLDCYEQHFDIVGYDDMLCYEAYLGMPSHYPHWVFGKAYERRRTFYRHNLAGLPYEMVINSDPCQAYLMRDNSLLLQILTMAHVYGHNDFFKNNRLFRRDTTAAAAVAMFKAHANRVRKYAQDPAIGPQAVERVIDAAHALRTQVSRHGQPLVAGRREMKHEGARQVPDRLKGSLLAFLAERGPLADWERDVVSIVHDEALYFIPQMETKILNEGWASFWHYRLMRRLGLPQSLYLEFLQRHNLIVSPHPYMVNPYFLGFRMFSHLEKTYGLKALMDIRADERDQSFLRRYLTRELCEELQLYTYAMEGYSIVIRDVADDKGWRAVRDALVRSAGLGDVPTVRPAAVEKGVLLLEHDYDGRELEMSYAKETLKHVVELWRAPVELLTWAQGRQIIVRCNEDKLISVPISTPTEYFQAYV